MFDPLTLEGYLLALKYHAELGFVGMFPEIIFSPFVFH